jgi:hypothetical protein
MPRNDGGCRHRTPVPLQRWHFMTLSPFLTRPLPSQFLHFCFFLMLGPLSFDIGTSMTCEGGKAAGAVTPLLRYTVSPSQKYTAEVVHA